MAGLAKASMFKKGQAKRILRRKLRSRFRFSFAFSNKIGFLIHRNSTPKLKKLYSVAGKRQKLAEEFWWN